MKVLISWSGSRSKYVAYLLRNWLPKVIQAVKPWMSEEDMSIGTRWAAEIASELEQTTVGVICLTPENQHNPWIMFEAGALSKTILHAYVCPYLIELSPSQLSGPLAQFQAATATKEGTSRVLQMLNRALGTLQIPSSELDEIFEVWWPRLQEQLATIPSELNLKPVKRTTDELLEELVNNTREQLRREEIRLKRFQERDTQIDEVLGKFDSAFSAMNTKSEMMVRKLLEKSLQLPDRTDVSNQDVPQESTVIDDPSKALTDILRMVKDLQIQSKQDTEFLLNKTKDDVDTDSTNSNDSP